MLLRFREILRSLFRVSAQRTMSGQNMASESANVRSNPTLGARGRTARRDKMDIWAWTLSAQQPKTLRMVTENQDAPYGCLKFFAKEHPPVTNQGCEYHFLAALGLSEAAGAAATRTMVPVVRESDGFTITLSDGVTPWTTWIVVPKSRPTLMS